MTRHNPLDELTIEQQAVLADLASKIQRGDTEPSVTRREALAGAGALGAGALLGGVGATAVTGGGAASPQGTAGTESAPLMKTWTHAIESGDGASQIDVPDTLAADGIAAVADTICHDGDTIEDYFGTNLSDGETLLIEQPATPYRHSSWLDIDNSDVTVIFESRYAENGDAITKVAPGADVGGIRIGNGAPVSNVRVVRHGHDGNKDNQDQSVTQLHGLIVDDATNVEIVRPYWFQTSPYHEHGSGGSGMEGTGNESEVIVDGALIEDIGDRGMEFGGDDIEVRNSYLNVGFDRMVADDQGSGATDLRVYNCTARGIEDGTAFGFNTGADIKGRGLTAIDAKGVLKIGSGASGNLEFEGLHAHECFAECIRIGPSFTGDGVRISDVNIWNTSESDPSHGIRQTGGTVDYSDVWIHQSTAGSGTGSPFRGITITGGEATFDGATIDGDSFDQALYTEVPITVTGLTTRNVASEDVQVSSGTGSIFWSADVQGTFFDQATATVLNGEAVESASAEEPQQSYPTGTMVRFTDAADGSGDGTYLIDRDGNAVQLTSNT